MLPNMTHFILFMSATVLLNLTPGSDVLFIGSQTLTSREQGIFATIGTMTGVAIWVLFTVFGLTSVLHQSIWLFNFIKFGGAVYLLYLAWQAFFTNSNSDSDMQITASSRSTKFKIYRKGILVNLSNPKVGLFFLTFLPQFIDQSKGGVWLQLLSLGICFIISGTLVNLMYVELFAHFKNRLTQHLGVRKILNKLTGTIFVLLALKVATTHQN